MIVIELTGAVDAVGTLQTFYLSDDPFVTTPSDTPPNTEFLGNLVNPGSFGTSVFGDGRTGGGATLQNGEIVVANNDGSLDVWKGYSFDGRAITIRSGDPEDGYPSSMTTLFTGTVEAVELNWTEVIIRVVDSQRSFQVPLLPNAYGGTNALPAGIDGTANDIKGKKKPRVYGRVYEITPECVNTDLLIYQVSDRAVNDISAVYDRGDALVFGSNYATNALLQAAAGLTAGHYYTCTAEGLFRLASDPAGLITADVTDQKWNYGTQRDWTPGNVLRRMVQDAGFTIESADVDALDALTVTTGTYWECGVYVTDSTTFEEAMNEVAQSVNAAYFFDALNVVRLGVLATPAGTPFVEIVKDTTLPGVEKVTPQESAVPPWAVVLHHSRIWTVQDSDLATGVDPARRAYLADEYRTVRSEDATVRTKWLLAQELEQWAVLADKTGATATVEAGRRLDIFKTNPDMFQVPIPLDIIQGTSFKLLDVVSWTVDRFDLSSGKLFLLLGIDLELADNKAVLLLWG